MSEKAQPEETTKFRQLTGFNRGLQLGLMIVLLLMCTLFILGIESYLGFAILKPQYNGAFIGLCLCLVFLGARPARHSHLNRIPWYDYILAAVGLAAGFFLTIQYPKLTYGTGVATPTVITFGAIFLLVVLEAIRRLQGWTMVILVAILVLYARFADLFPGLLEAPVTPWPTLLTYLYIDPNSMLFLLGMAATIVFAFVIFSQVLFVFGGVNFIEAFCFALVGQFRGASAKIAVVASGLFGTMTGGAVANVLVTGSFTIPMMKKAGFQPHVAAAVEAVASCGGQIMPPVMGIAAFIIAEFLGVSYAEVAKAAIIPALLYYFSLFIQIDLSAAKAGIKGIGAGERPPLKQAIGISYLFVLPIGILIYLLFFRRMQAPTAGTATFLLSLAIACLSKDNRREFGKKFLKMMDGAIKVLLTVTVILVGAGFIVGALSISGLASSIGGLLVDLSGGNLTLLLILAAVGCMIMGMGMPTTAAYVMVAIVVAPALAAMKVVPLAAHLFIFYFAVIANYTPPVAIAAYAAASLANTSAMRTGYTALRLGMPAFIVPFLFVFSPALILQGTVGEIVAAILSALAGTGLMGIGISGYLFQEIGFAKRLLVFVSAASFLFPLIGYSGLAWVGNLTGIILAGIFFTLEWLRKKPT